MRASLPPPSEPPESPSKYHYGVWISVYEFERDPGIECTTLNSSCELECLTLQMEHLEIEPLWQHIQCWGQISFLVSFPVPCSALCSSYSQLLRQRFCPFTAQLRSLSPSTVNSWWILQWLLYQVQLIKDFFTLKPGTVNSVSASQYQLLRLVSSLLFCRSVSSQEAACRHAMERHCHLLHWGCSRWPGSPPGLCNTCSAHPALEQNQLHSLKTLCLKPAGTEHNSQAGAGQASLGSKAED